MVLSLRHLVERGDVPVEQLRFPCCAAEARRGCSFGVPADGIFLFAEEKILFIVNPRGFPKLAL